MKIIARNVEISYREGVYKWEESIGKWVREEPIEAQIISYLGTNTISYGQDKRGTNSKWGNIPWILFYISLLIYLGLVGLIQSVSMILEICRNKFDNKYLFV